MVQEGFSRGSRIQASCWGKPLSAAEFQAEKEKAVGDGDHFILFYTGFVSLDIPDALLKHCAIVDRSCWEEYFGPFAARGLLVHHTS